MTSKPKYTQEQLWKIFVAVWGEIGGCVYNKHWQATRNYKGGY